MNKIEILIVEDEKGINDIEKKYLEKEGYEVDQAFDGKDALEQLSKKDYDLVILDRMLPKVSGEEIMHQIRASSDTAVIMISAKVEEDNIIEGLKIGADDYITKPFSPREMVERVKTVLRRTERNKMPRASLLVFDQGRFQIDHENKMVYKDDELVNLTSNEFKIVTTLFSNPKKIFTRDEIIEIAFGIDYDAFDRAIDTHIKNIRHKIEDDPKNPRYIKTIYGMGYKAGVEK
ncbi:MAG: response regulator transcription factor [Tissierellia bacterium]|nr:response regulator transcription factor [Tissierellia bacterium]